MKPILIYLAGGMKSGWQDKVKEACRDLVMSGVVDFFDPRKNSKDPKIYRANDKKNWEEADIVFAYAESSNPALYAMCIELTGGFYNGAWTIFVDNLRPETMATAEKMEAEEKRRRYLSFIEIVSHKKALGLPEGISILRSAIDERVIYNYKPE